MSCSPVSKVLFGACHIERLDFLKIILHNPATLSAAQSKSGVHGPHAGQAARDPGRANQGHWAVYQACDRSATLHRSGRSSTKSLSLFCPMKEMARMAISSLVRDGQAS